MLADHLLTNTAPGPNGEDRLVVTTLVSSSLLSTMAREYGVHFAETFTGFKWIARAALDRPQLRLLFAYEQALGYLVAPRPLDKDGISAAVLLAEIAAVAFEEGTTIQGRLDDIAARYGRHVVAERALRMEPEAGAAAVRALQDDPPASVLDVRVADVRAFPEADLVRLVLEGGVRLQVRPSGTEPKVKLYGEAVDRDPTPYLDALAALLQRCRTDRLQVVARSKRPRLDSSPSTRRKPGPASATSNPTSTRPVVPAAIGSASNVLKQDGCRRWSPMARSYRVQYWNGFDGDRALTPTVTENTSRRPLAVDCVAPPVSSNVCRTGSSPTSIGDASTPRSVHPSPSGVGHSGNTSYWPSDEPVATSRSGWVELVDGSSSPRPASRAATSPPAASSATPTTPRSRPAPALTAAAAAGVGSLKSKRTPSRLWENSTGVAHSTSLTSVRIALRPSATAASTGSRRSIRAV